ncbi:TonB-dependent siderophore receptor, partial [Nitrosomonas sp.]|uniref:TonB-dependent siderophore receptor n=2 Tax=Nitrosomonas sp. TaxID=42353 RepID=UPI0033058E1B
SFGNWLYITPVHRGTKQLAHAGSWNNYRGELDVGGPIMAEGRIRGRLVGVYEDRKYFYDVAKSDKYLFYGIVEADITDSTLLTLGSDFMRQDSTNWRWGLPRYSHGEDLGLPRSTFFGTNDDQWSRKNNRQFLRIDQAIGTNWTLGIEASRAHSKVNQRDFLWWGAVDPITLSGFYSNGGHGWLNDRTETQQTLDAVLKGAFHLLGREHKVILGTNINRYKSGTVNYRRIGSNIQIPNIFEFNPADYRFNDPYFLTNEEKTTITQKGVYGSLAAKITDPLTLVVGGRFSWYKYDYNFDRFDQNTGATTFTLLTQYEDNTIFTPYLGLVYDLTEQWTTYASFAETYQSQASSRKGPLPGTPLKPITGRSYEIGVKGSLFNERLNTALAFFSIKRNGQAIQDPSYPPFSGDLGSSCCYLDGGRITSRGVDIEVSGEIVDGWQVLAGYTFNDNENKADSIRYSTITPKHLFKLWSSYELRGILSGLKLGGGITAQSGNYVSGTARAFNATTGLYNGPSVNYEFTEPGRVLVDLFAQYRLNKHWSATLNVNNVFDKKYYQTVGTSSIGNWYGTPRNFLVSMQYSY